MLRSVYCQKREVLNSVGGNKLFHSASKLFLISAVLFISVLSPVFAQQNPSAPPASTSSYSLQDIYNRLDNGADPSPQNFTEPTTGPSVKTMYTLGEIMSKAPVVNSSGALESEVLSGKVFWGVNAGEWGIRTGKMSIPTPDLQQVTDQGAVTSNTITAAGIIINNAAQIDDSTNPPSPTTDRLYNNGGNLFWNGTQLDAPAANIDKDKINNNGTLGFDWSDSEVADNLTISGGAINNSVIGGTTPAAGTFTTLAGSTLNTGLGAYELYAMDQNVRTTDAPTFATVNTGQGANELYAMNQDVQTDDNVTFGKATLIPSTATLDQSNFPALFYFGLPSGAWGAQVFTSGMTGNLSKVKITIGHQGTPGDVNISIHTGNSPNSGGLISSVETVTITTHYLSPLDYEVTFATPAPVTATQQYYILYEPQTQNVSVGGQTSSTYPGGNMWSSGFSYAGYDYAFETYVIAGGDVLDVQGVAVIEDTTNPPSTTTDRLYNNGGNLYWNGTQLDTGGAASIDKDQINNTGTLGFDWADSEIADNLTISGGAINNSAIGGTTPAAGSFTTLKMTTSPSAGKILTSDANGNGTWETAPNVNKDQINNSGTLGFTWGDSEVANNLTIASGAIDNSPIGGTTPAAGAFTTLKMTTSPGAGKVLTSDASGNASWATASGGGTNIDTITISHSQLDSGTNGFSIGAVKMKYSGTIVNYQIYAQTAAGATIDLTKNGSSVLSAPTAFVSDTVVEGTVNTTSFAANDVFRFMFNNASDFNYSIVCTLMVQYN